MHGNLEKKRPKRQLLNYSITFKLVLVRYKAGSTSLNVFISNIKEKIAIANLKEFIP